MSGIGQLPPKVQERLQRLQNLQNTLQQILVQKQRIEIERMESEKALETLKDVTSDSKVYKSVGAVLVEKPRDDIIKELEDRKEFLDMRIKVIVKQEEKTREKMTGIQETLQKELGLPSGRSGPAHSAFLRPFCRPKRIRYASRLGFHRIRHVGRGFQTQTFFRIGAQHVDT